MARVSQIPVNIGRRRIVLDPRDARVVKAAISKGKAFTDEESVGDFLNSLTRDEYQRLSAVQPNGKDKKPPYKNTPRGFGALAMAH